MVCSLLALMKFWLDTNTRMEPKVVAYYYWLLGDETFLQTTFQNCFDFPITHEQENCENITLLCVPAKNFPY